MAGQAERRTPRQDWRQRRLARGLSLSEVARRAGLNKGVLSAIETRRTVPLPDEAEAILRVLAQAESEVA